MKRLKDYNTKGDISELENIINPNAQISTLLMIYFLCYLKSVRIISRLGMEKTSRLHIVTQQYLIRNVDSYTCSFHIKLE